MPGLPKWENVADVFTNDSNSNAAFILKKYRTLYVTFKARTWCHANHGDMQRGRRKAETGRPRPAAGSQPHHAQVSPKSAAGRGVVPGFTP